MSEHTDMKESRPIIRFLAVFAITLVRGYDFFMKTGMVAVGTMIVTEALLGWYMAARMINILLVVYWVVLFIRLAVSLTTKGSVEQRGAAAWAVFIAGETPVVTRWLYTGFGVLAVIVASGLNDWSRVSQSLGAVWVGVSTLVLIRLIWGAVKPFACMIALALSKKWA